MLAPDVGSTNTDPTHNDKTPLVPRKIFSRISNLWGGGGVSRSRSNSEYVEFGSLHEQHETRTLGTFAGVFSPVTLSMFSALIFLRVGYIVGNAGLLVTLLQFAIAYAILLFTVASVCAISTNGAVEGGGAYFMISRTLGPEFGGSIGTLFFFANVVNSALNIAGCVEGFVENFGPSGYLLASGSEGLVPNGAWFRFLYCSILNTLNLIVCLIGATMFAKTSVLILMIVLACVSTTIIGFLVEGPLQVAIPDMNKLVHPNTTGLYTGLSSATLAENLYSNYSRDYTSPGHEVEVDFAAVFGVLFSGVTGIMAGANMSGELKNPARNIPSGTLSAVGFTLIIYLLVSVLTAATSSRFLLQNDYLYMEGVSVWSPSVAVGLLTATWSASLSNIIGGSRVVEALAKDHVFGSVLNFIPKGTWRGNPIAAVITAWALVQLVLIIGSLNVIAQLNSVLFLLSYLATNLACLGLELASAPNFRPAFKYFTWHTALVGLLGTLIMMFVINPLYAICSMVLCLVLVMFLHFFSPSKEAHWGSISQALIFHQVRKYLLLLDSRKDHVKFWRPQVLLMVSNPRSSCPLIDFVNDLKKGGLYVLGHVTVGNPELLGADPTIAEIPHWLSLVDHLRVKAFVELTLAKTVREGFQHLIRISGMGAMKPNTIILGFPDQDPVVDFLQRADSPYCGLEEFPVEVFPIRGTTSLTSLEYVSMINDVLRLNKNVCLCRNFSQLNKQMKRRSNIKYIDVWPINFLSPGETDAFDTTSLFMMQLACIVNMGPAWRQLTLRICICDEATRVASFSLQHVPPNFGDKLKRLLKLLRITAEIYSVKGWDQVIGGNGAQGVSFNSVDSGDLMSSVSMTSTSSNAANNTYLNKVNNMIRNHSDNTGVTFVYLPAPPEGQQRSVYPLYFQMLSTITDSLPPSILVHGVSTVTSTTL